MSVDGILEPIELQPGQFITGRFSLHKDYYGNKKIKIKSALTVWRWLEVLEKCENLNIKSYNKYSIITVNNWNQYQQSEQQMNNRRTTDEQQMNTNKNDKNVKNIYGEFKNVKLTDEEYQKLKTKFGEDGTKQRIENLSEYIASKGKKYSNHYATILTWERKNIKEDKKPCKTPEWF